MAVIKVNPKNQTEIEKKPRVYFTCHPDDFATCFTVVCDYIFATHDCAVYYTEDMTESMAEEDKKLDIGRNILLVVPVTRKLLLTKNRAMDADIPFAMHACIPILPVMMEPELDAIYGRPDRFGELQYLNPFSTDTTEISFREKLEKHLNTVLPSEEMTERVRAAFSARIFLSYRKKDRYYANELMRLIHKHPGCYDIAVWYDEFLTPGESFKKNIEAMLETCALFAMLVTPNLLEEPDGKPNFVMGEEYPAANRLGMKILPVEMVDTDQHLLSEKFDGIPDCVKPSEDAFVAGLLEQFRDASACGNKTAEHNFLVGLAYLGGIDVEVDRERAEMLITAAAEAGLPEAMEKLYWMYSDGIGVAQNAAKALKWAKAYKEYAVAHYSEDHPQALPAISNLAVAYAKAGELEAARELYEKAYPMTRTIYGMEDRRTLQAMNNIAFIYDKLGDHEKALALHEKAYTLRREILGETNRATMASLSNLALTYHSLGNYEKAFELCEKAYCLRRDTLGEKDRDTLKALSNLASVCGALKDYPKALALNEKAYALRREVLGERDRDTLLSLSNLAIAYDHAGERQKGLELLKKTYEQYCAKWGTEDPASREIQKTIEKLHEKAQLEAKVAELRGKAAEQTAHPGAERLRLETEIARVRAETGEMEELLAQRKAEIGGLEEKLETAKEENARLKEEQRQLLEQLAARFKVRKVFWDQTCSMIRKTCGESGVNGLASLCDLATACQAEGAYGKALEWYQESYTRCCQTLGAEHPVSGKLRNCLSLLTPMAERMDRSVQLLKKHDYPLPETPVVTEVVENAPAVVPEVAKPIAVWGQSLPECKKIYALRRKVLGKKNPETLSALSALAEAYSDAGKGKKAQKLLERVYALRCEVLGNTHPDTLETQKRLDGLKKKINS